MLEKVIEKKSCDWAATQGWLSAKLTSPSFRGWPDRVFMREGRVVFIEFKTPTGRTTPLQEACLNRLRSAGAETHVCHSIDEVKDALS